LKVVYYNFFFGRSILVVFCRAVANPGPGAKLPMKKFRLTDEIRSFKRQLTDITHSLQCVLEF